MGVVYIARDPELQRDVALKVLRPGGAGTDSTQAQERMLREAQAMAMLSHPNMVAIYEVGTFRKHVFIAMEYVIGKTLDDWLDDGQHLEDVYEVFAEAGAALQAIHDAGLVHRDFKPANVLVTNDGHAKVLDLGIARKVATQEPFNEQASADAPPSRVAEQSAGPTTDDVLLSESPGSAPDTAGHDAFEKNLTQEGALVGTPSYMSPEQLLGTTVGPTTDQFAFAVTFFEALTGYRPFKGATHVQIMANILSGSKRPWPDDSDVPEGLRQAIARALNSGPDKRYASMSEFLRACQAGLGLRGQIRYLTARWKDKGRDREYLLGDGSLLTEGVDLLRHQPRALSEEQKDFIAASQRAAQLRRVGRRVMLWGLGSVTVGLVPTALLLDRRSRQLEAAMRSEVLASIAAVAEAVTPVLDGAREELDMMFAQRAAWWPMMERLLSQSEPSEDSRDAMLQKHIADLNTYFRPVVERIGIISSLMVASDEGVEYLAFLDPDARKLNPPYYFYNRMVQRGAYGDSAFQVFWPEEPGSSPRSSWLRVGEPDSRGTPWKGYMPERRVWFRNAAQRQDAVPVWTEPYLFFVTKDAGITGSIAWTQGAVRYVLAVDFMLTDLSLITSQLDSPDLVAAIVSKNGECIGLPQDKRFTDKTSVREFFASRNRPDLDVSKGKVDASAALPFANEVGPPYLVAAMQPYATRSDTYQFEYEGQTLWAGRAPVGDRSLGLTIYVVQRPEE
jgi:serine/threonine protein kinase